MARKIRTFIVVLCLIASVLAGVAPYLRGAAAALPPGGLPGASPEEAASASSGLPAPGGLPAPDGLPAAVEAARSALRRLHQAGSTAWAQAVLPMRRAAALAGGLTQRTLRVVREHVSRLTHAAGEAPRTLAAGAGRLGRLLAPAVLERPPWPEADPAVAAAPRSSAVVTFAGSPSSAAGEGGTGGAGDAVAAAAAARAAPGHRIKTAEELRVEGLIDGVFREYFRRLTVGGRTLTVRMPFALNYEREGRPGFSQTFYLDGKGTPRELWPHIEGVLSSEAFRRYAAEVAAPGEKVITFQLERGAYTVSRDPELLEQLRRGPYPGTPTAVFVYKAGEGLSQTDVYNYLYAVAAVGVDCSGFAHHVQEAVARSYGVELDRQLGKHWRLDPATVRRRVGLWFYDPAQGYTEAVPDCIEDLRPGDMILFRGSDGNFKHSAVVQSIDFEKGLLRYIQSTDWATEAERGVHMSMVHFDPLRPQVSLRHYSVIWLQQVRPPFAGEQEPRDWSSDGDRYLYYLTNGGSMVVRPKFMAELFLAREPRFYTNLYGEAGPGTGSPLPGPAPSGG